MVCHLLLGVAYATAAAQRLGPHFLGWVPYAVSWRIITSTFAHSVDRVDTSEGDGEAHGPPSWVSAIIYGQLGTHAVFALVQLFQQSSDRGCANYWKGEVAYIIMSLTAKLALGGVLYVNLLMYCAGLGKLTDE